MRPHVAVSLLSALLLAAAPARADAPAGGAFPAPGPSGGLPPPTVRRLVAGQPAGPVTPSAPRTITTVTPTGGAFASPDGGRSWQPVRASAPARPVTGTRVLSVDARPQAVTGGGSELRVTTRFYVEGDQGRSFYVNALFFDAASGAALTSRNPAFADRGTGALLLLSQPMVHGVAAGEYQADLQVPYGAFPAADGGVEARVSLFRRSLSGGMDEVMDWTGVPVALPESGPAWSPPTPEPASVPAAGPFPAPSVGEALPAQPASRPAAAPAAAGGGARLLGVSKNHNLPMQGGALGLRLDVRFRVEAPGAYALRAEYVDASTGRPVLSQRPTFADPQGALYVQTQAAAAQPGEYGTSLWVPYGAFPNPGAGGAREVEARIYLERWQGAERSAVVDQTATRFSVHGS